MASLPVSRFFMSDAVFVVGPTAIGKSALAAEVAERLDAEIINADAFQIYRGVDILTGKPDAGTQRRVRHHLLGSVPLTEPMSAAKFREMALSALAEIRARGKKAIVVGGSGLYVKALTCGFDAPPPDPGLRAKLRGLSLSEQVSRLITLNPKLASTVDTRNPRRVIRALEIASADIAFASRRHRQAVVSAAISTSERSSAEKTAATMPGILLIRDRDDLYQRINNRVSAMFRQGVIEEARALNNIGPTAARALGLREIQELLAGEISLDDCVAKIQRATRRYAKRQLTWFRHQSSFPELNLTTLSHSEAIRAISHHLAQE
ncbi:MAG: tRNA dimethylallyltransferase [Verrucomicrobiota bacterium]